MRILKNMTKKFAKLTLLGKMIVLVILYFILNQLANIMQWTGFNTGNYILEGMGGDASEFVFFHWKDCGFCKQMQPEWNKFKGSYKGKISLRDVEKDSQPSSKYKNIKINSYPTLLVLDKKGNKVGEFNAAARTVASFESFLKKYEKKK